MSGEEDELLKTYEERRIIGDNNSALVLRTRQITTWSRKQDGYRRE